MQENTVALYVRQLLLALCYLQQRQVRHGALNFTTVTLSSRLPDAIIKISDAGLASIFDPKNELLRKKPTCFNSYRVIFFSS